MDILCPGDWVVQTVVYHLELLSLYGKLGRGGGGSIFRITLVVYAFLAETGRFIWCIKDFWRKIFIFVELITIFVVNKLIYWLGPIKKMYLITKRSSILFLNQSLFFFFFYCVCVCGRGWGWLLTDISLFYKHLLVWIED